MLPKLPNFGDAFCRAIGIVFLSCLGFTGCASWDTWRTQPAFVLDISPYWDRKLAAIRCYHSQFVEGRAAEGPSFLDRLRDEAAFWGKTIGVRYGEPYACREPVGLSSLQSLV